VPEFEPRLQGGAARLDNRAACTAIVYMLNERHCSGVRGQRHDRATAIKPVVGWFLRENHRAVFDRLRTAGGLEFSSAMNLSSDAVVLVSISRRWGVFDRSLDLAVVQLRRRGRVWADVSVVPSAVKRSADLTCVRLAGTVSLLAKSEAARP